MCLWFDSCFGRNVRQDYGHEPSMPKHAADARVRTTTYQPPPWNGADHGQQRNGNQGQGYHGNGHKASYQMTADESGRKAHNDARKDHAVVAGAVATRDGLPARNNKVGDDTCYKARLYEPAVKDTTGYQYPTTTIATYY